MNGLWKTILCVLVTLVAASPCLLSGADMLKWDTDRERVEAQVETWSVPQVLERIAAVTGWQILVDPSINSKVPTKFRDKSTGDALQRLLGSLNYAFVPETNKASKLYVFRNSRDEATRVIAPVKAAKKKGLIENELIVKLKPGESIDELAKRLGAKVVGRSEGQNAYRLRFDDADATQDARESLLNDPSAASVDNNYTVTQPIDPELLGGPGAPLALRPTASPDGKHVIVGLIDSAVQGKEGNIADFLLPGLSVGGESPVSSADPSHGTSMAETILRGLQYAGGEGGTTVRILPVDVYGGTETTSTFDVAAGIYKAVNNGAMIVNLSLGSDGDSRFLYDTIKSAHDQGVVFLGAAGNEPVTTPTFPAAYSEVIAVTASDRRGNIASYANYGGFVDAMAPGTSLVTFRGQQFYVVGTSASTAYASGLAAAAAEVAKQKGGGSIESAVRSALAPKPAGK